MAVAHVQAATISNATAFAGDGIAEITFGSTTVAGNRVLIAFGIDASSRSVTSVTDTAGNTYSLVTQGGTDATGEQASNPSECWIYSAPVTTGFTQATITLSSAFSGDCSIVAVEVSGQHASTPFEDVVSTVTGAAETTHDSGNVTFAAGGGYLFGYMYGTFGVYTIDADFTSLQNVSKAICGYDLVASSGTYSMTNTSGGNESLNKILVAIQAAAGGGSSIAALSNYYNMLRSA